MPLADNAKTLSATLISALLAISNRYLEVLKSSVLALFPENLVPNLDRLFGDTLLHNFMTAKNELVGKCGLVGGILGAMLGFKLSYIPLLS